MTVQLPAAIIWCALVLVSAFYLFRWRQVGRDPKPGVVIPRFSAPDGLSPPALYFAYRLGGAEDVTVNAGVLSALAELLRRRLLHIEESPAGPRITPVPGDRKGLPADLGVFLDNLLPPGRTVATVSDTTTAAAAAHAHYYRTLAPRIWRTSIGTTGAGAVVLIIATIVTAFLLRATDYHDDAGMTFGGGFAAGLALLVGLRLRTTRLRGQRWLARGLTAFGGIILLIFLVVELAITDQPDGWVRAAALLGIFLVFPVIALAASAMIQVSESGRRLLDEIEGFRMFIAVADAGRHAIDSAPDPTADGLDALMPYAIALQVEAGWVNALAAALPIRKGG